jgi:hypothetical protein
MESWQGTARVALEAGRAGGGMAYQEAGAEPRAGLALHESCLRRPSRSLVGAERVDEDGVHGRYIAGGESHLARTTRKWGDARRRRSGMIGGTCGCGRLPCLLFSRVSARRPPPETGPACLPFFFINRAGFTNSTKCDGRSEILKSNFRI